MTAAWTAPRTWVVGELVTAALLNTHLRDNLDWLKTPLESGVVTFSGDFTTTSTTYTDLTGITTTITTKGGGLDLFFSCVMFSSTPAQSRFQVLIDGVASGVLGQHFNSSTTVPSQFSVFHHIVAQSAGSHTIKLQVLTTAGTLTIKGSSASLGGPEYFVREAGG